MSDDPKPPKGWVVPAAGVASAALVLGAWVLVYRADIAAYAAAGHGAEWVILKRGILLGGLTGLVVALALLWLVGPRDEDEEKSGR
jgi:hypothetical protein